jgi:peptidyl-prolyl cis-trans isomerase SurA
MELLKLNKTRVVLIQVMLLLYSCFNVQANTVIIDRIVAIVNDEIITFSEFNKYKTLMYMGMPNQGSGGDFDREVLSQIIEKKIVIQEAKKLKIEVKKKEIDMAIENVLKRNKITLKNLELSLAEQGSTFEEYRRLLKDEIMQSHVVGREVQAQITITNNDIKKYYEENIKPKEKPGGRVKISQILLLSPKDSNQAQTKDAEQKINEIREKIVAGENFEEMAALYSQGPGAKMGGDLGYFNKGELMPAIEEAAFSMEKGELSKVIKTPIGYHLIKLIDKEKTEQDLSWKDHMAEIEGDLYNHEFERIYRDWIQGLKGKAYIEVNF